MDRSTFQRVRKVSDAGRRNLELIGGAIQEDKTVSVQLPDGSFVKMTPTQAKAFQEKNKNESMLANALRAFQEREKSYKQEMDLLQLGGSDPSGKDTLRKMLRRR